MIVASEKLRMKSSGTARFTSRISFPHKGPLPSKFFLRCYIAVLYHSQHVRLHHWWPCPPSDSLPNQQLYYNFHNFNNDHSNPNFPPIPPPPNWATPQDLEPLPILYPAPFHRHPPLTNLLPSPRPRLGNNTHDYHTDEQSSPDPFPLPKAQCWDRQATW